MVKSLPLLAGALALSGGGLANARPVIVDGVWGGGQSVVTVARGGLNLETGCAQGAVTGPVRLDAHGRFAVKGVLQGARPGPQLADEGAGRAAATFSGQIRGDTMRLEIRTATGAQSYTLKRGVRPKLIRCL